jgi:glycosyltransferase involved in cell wall biosynthesis
VNRLYRISVVIPCYNHGEFVGEAVESVVGAKREDVELIVVDDGSTDKRTPQEMDKLEARGIKVVRQENRGLSAARNAAIVASQGEYIFPLDADDRMRSGWIDRAIEILDSNPKVGVAYGDAEYFGTSGGRWRVGPFDVSRLLAGNYIHASALYRRSVWERNRGYDVAMVHGFEDWDFWLGALEHGWQFRYIPEVFFEYRQAMESMITRARGFGDEIGEFVGRKHGLLYRREWVRLALERQSITKTSRRVRTILKAKMRRGFADTDANFWIPG